MSDAAVSEREQKVLQIIETARSKRPKFKSETVTMAHGAGGKATQTLIEGLLVPALAGSSEALEEMGDAGTVTIDGLGLALTTDSFVVAPDPLPRRLDRRARRQRDRQRPRRRRGPPAGAQPLADPRGGPAADELRAEVEAIAAAAEAAEVEIVTGDTKVVERGHADGMYICTAGLGKIDERASSHREGSGPGTGSSSPAPIGDHGSAIMLARDEFSLDAEITSDTQPLWPAVDALLDAAGEGLHCMRDATRGGVASVLNELARASGSRSVVAGGRRAGEPGGRRRSRDARDRPDVRRQRGQARRLRRGGAGGGRARPRCARCRAARRRPRSER